MCLRRWVLSFPYSTGVYSGGFPWRQSRYWKEAGAFLYGLHSTRVVHVVMAFILWSLGPM